VVGCLKKKKGSEKGNEEVVKKTLGRRGGRRSKVHPKW